MDSGLTDTLAVDAVTVRVVPALRASGVEPILLKGRSFAAWLYAGSGGRVYGDCDLLVSPAQRQTAEDALAALGFAPVPLPPGPHDGPDGAHHSQAWVRRSDGANVDLHTSIWGAFDHDVAWQQLSKGTERLRLGPIEVTVLDEPGRCVHAVLHAMQHPAEDQPQDDLERALAKADDLAWARAVELARRIGAGEAFIHYLSAHARGVELMRRLGVSAGGPPDLALSLLVTRDQTGADAIEWLLALSSWRARAAAIRHKLVPNAVYVRFLVEDPQTPRPIASLYLRYWLRQARKTPRAVLHWLQAWRSVRRRRGSG